MRIIEETEIPILGVCLGMQAIAVYNGAKVCTPILIVQNILLNLCFVKIVNTPDLKHGHVIPVQHNRTSIFDCIPGGGSSEELKCKAEQRTETVDVVAYNSLTVSWQGNYLHSSGQSRADTGRRLSARQAARHSLARSVRLSE
jgi:para-aminobenzoate synthetase